MLFDLINLALQGKQAHWNVTGPLFQPVHTQLDLVVNDARLWADDVAERLVTISIPARVESVAGSASGAVERLADLDLASQDLVIEVVRGLEKHLWILCAQLG